VRLTPGTYVTAGFSFGIAHWRRWWQIGGAAPAIRMRRLILK
jgi:hypothetical protein